MKPFNPKLLLAAPLLFLAAACASPTGEPRFDEASITSDSRFADYEKVYIADVKISEELRTRDPRPSQIRNGTADRPVSDRDLNSKAADLRRDLKRQIGRTKQVVSSPGEGVLVVQAELIDIASNRPTKADYSDQPGLDFRSKYVGGSNVRVTISADGQTLATVRENYRGNFDDPTNVAIWSDADRGFYITASKVAQLIG